MAYWQSRTNDTRAQEATPEELRIAVDEVFRKFLYSDQTEYTFESNLTNLQRKYIHEKAKMMNLVSKSKGKEPNRQLTISKRKFDTNKETCFIDLCNDSSEILRNLVDSCQLEDLDTNHRERNVEKNFGSVYKFTPPIVPPPNVPKDIKKLKQELPVTDLKKTVLNLIANNQVVIISSETGSGKSTQIPQFILEDSCNTKKRCRIICTQPRRISTVAVAERVAKERGEEVGSIVGYHIRLESKLSHRTSLIYCTNGVFIRNLMANTVLTSITHVIIDEVHERDRQSDFILICLKKVLPVNPHLRVILMSATVNVEKFKGYFENAEVLKVQGRLHDIQEFFLDEILLQTRYMSPKMHELIATTNKIENEEAGSTRYPEMDTALNDCLRSDSLEAWSQLLIYILTESLPIDYQHSQTGLTALMVAAINNNLQYLEIILGHGPDINLKCNRDRTALDWAKHRENAEAVNFLENAVVEVLSQENLLEVYIKSVTDDLLDLELMCHVVKYIHQTCEPGAILVFLPGYDEIIELDGLISSRIERDDYEVFFLHSSMNIRDQNDVFAKLLHKRKIVLSTNIAETSITIDDVKFVVDCGKVKEKTYDSFSGLCCLQAQWISQACVKQRAGRAGRVSDGYCFHMFSRQRYKHMQEETTPEILRVPLEPLCLSTRIIAPKYNLEEFFACAPDPPSPNLVKAAITQLVALGAMTEDEKLTALGEYLGQLTIEPHMGKMLIYSVIFKCLDPILTLVAILTQRDPFLIPPYQYNKARLWVKRFELVKGIPSDHLLYLEVFKEWQQNVIDNTEREFLNHYQISKASLESALAIRTHLLTQLRSAGFAHSHGPFAIDQCNAHSNNWAVVKAVIASGLYPRIAYVKKQLRTRTESSVHISTSSCLQKMFDIAPNLWYIYEEISKIRSTSTIRVVTCVTPITIALLCGNVVDSSTLGEMSIDAWLNFRIKNHGLFFLRRCLDKVINKILSSRNNELSPLDKSVINTLAEILELEDEAAEIYYRDFAIGKPKVLEKPNYRHRHREIGPISRPLPKPNKYNQHSQRNYYRVPDIEARSSVSSSTSTSTGSGTSASNALPGVLNGSNGFLDNGHSSRKCFDDFAYPYDSAGPNYGNINMTDARSTSRSPQVANPQISSPIGGNVHLGNRYLSGFERGQHQHTTGMMLSARGGGGILEAAAVCDVGFLSTASPIAGFVNESSPAGVVSPTETTPNCFSVVPKDLRCDESIAKLANSLLVLNNVPDSNTLGDSENISYILIKPKQVTSVTISYETSKWVLSPQTQNKVLSYYNQGRFVRLIFAVQETKTLYGVALFVGMTQRRDKSEVELQWLFKSELPYSELRALNSQYNVQGKFIYEGFDGDEINSSAGNDIYFMYFRRSQPHN